MSKIRFLCVKNLQFMKCFQMLNIVCRVKLVIMSFFDNDCVVSCICCLEHLVAFLDRVYLLCQAYIVLIGSDFVHCCFLWLENCCTN